MCGSGQTPVGCPPAKAGHVDKCVGTKIMGVFGRSIGRE